MEEDYIAESDNNDVTEEVKEVYQPDPLFEELKKEYYSNLGVKFEVVKNLIQRETACINVVNAKKTLRCLKINAVKYLNLNAERYGVFENAYNIYGSLAKFPNLPVFSFSSYVKRKQQDKFNDEFRTLMTSFDFLMDIDNPDIEEARQSLLKVVKIFNKYKVPFRTKFSISGDTPVMIKQNNKIQVIEIEKAVKQYKKDSNMETLSLDINNNLTFSKIYDTIEHDDELYEVYYDGTNLPIKITKHHSLMFLDKDLNIVKKKITDDLTGCYLISYNNSINLKKEKDLIINVPYIFNKKNNNYNLEITNELLELVGFYLGDGFLIRNSHEICFSVNINKSHITKKIRKALKNIPNLQNKKNKINVTELFNNPNVRRIRFCNAIIYQFLEQNFKKLAHYKELPSWVFQLDKEKVISLLKGYIQTGGHNAEYDIQIKSVSFKLIRQFVWLLKMHNINCRVLYEKHKPHKLPQGNMFQGSETYNLYIPKSELTNTKYFRPKNKFSPEPRGNLYPTKKLYEIYYKIKPYGVKFHRTDYQILRKEMASPERILNTINWFQKEAKVNFDIFDLKIIKKYMNLIFSDLSLKKIKRIKKINKIEKVYDFSVEDTHTFFAGEMPIFASNSGSKGFHAEVDYEDFPDWLKQKSWDDIASLLKTFAENFKIINNIPDIDLAVFDLRRINKTPYTVVYPYYLVALPLSDKDIDNFDLKHVSLPYICKNIDKIKNRGLLKREGSKEGFSNLLKDYLEV